MPYAASREAFSEFEPERPRAGLPAVAVKPGTEIPPNRLPATGAVPPGLTGRIEAPPPPSADPYAAAPSEVPREVPPQKTPQTAALPAVPPPAAVVAPAGEPLWKRNAARITLQPGLPRIGVVIDDLGLDRKRTERAMGLPAPVTLAFLPYGRRLGDETARARKSGHEILVHVPMEPEGKGADPGPNALLTGSGTAELRVRLDWALSRFDGYVGINNHMGSKFTSDPKAMDLIAAELKARGLLFLDSRTAKSAVAFDRARAAGVPAAVRQVFLDRDPARKAIDAELKRLEDLARRYGSAIAIGHPHDKTLDALDAWLPTLAAKGLQLAPVSALVE